MLVVLGCALITSCNYPVLPMATIEYCNTGSVYLPWDSVYLSSNVSNWSEYYGNRVFKTAQEMTDAGVPDYIIDQVDFSTEMAAAFIYGCSSCGTGPSAYGVSAGTDCNTITINYVYSPGTGGGGINCMSYFCANSFLKIRKSSLPVVFVQVTASHDQDSDGINDRDEMTAGTDAWDPASRP